MTKSKQRIRLFQRVLSAGKEIRRDDGAQWKVGAVSDSGGGRRSGEKVPSVTAGVRHAGHLMYITPFDAHGFPAQDLLGFPPSTCFYTSLLLEAPSQSVANPPFPLV